ncbi:hypothetical protein PCANC_01441 [Puccinia coronata f. sp. avenae]|uniref:Uncharacterized protein n=1 Tax=Puccinia coronata f. sp. avenae TaxID=200324 RepID=A0A2N5W2U2_9BASI|nr:hypothetical protein PCANC_01441 [Puccinia coronata f. sp. avenae]
MDPIHEDFINPSDVSGSNFPTSGQPYNWRMRQPTSDKISAASSSAQLEAEQNNVPRTENSMADISLEPGVESESEDAVRRCYKKHLGNFLSWRKFCELILGRDHISEVEQNLIDLQQAMSTLFVTRLRELRREGLTVTDTQRYIVPDLDVVIEINENMKSVSLESVAQFEQIRELLLRANEEMKLNRTRGLPHKEDRKLKPQEIRELLFKANGEVEINQVVEKGYELIINLLVDLQKFQIISDEDLSFLLNHKKDGQLILAHAINSFHKSDSTAGFFYTEIKEEFMDKSTDNFHMAGLLKCELIFPITFCLY